MTMMLLSRGGRRFTGLLRSQVVVFATGVPCNHHGLSSNSTTSVAATYNNGNGSPNNRRSLALVGIVASIGGGACYLNEHLGGSEGLLRTASFYSLAIPKYVQYRYHMMMDSPDEVWDNLHKETSKAGLDKIMELQGFYVKSGQMCAANIGNAFPEIWQETMAPLQNECPARPFTVVKSIIESEFGKKICDIFDSFEESPIGAASIGQVHRATLKDGNRVVVKVMYPGVEDVFRGDVRTIKMFAQLAQPVHVPPLIEIEKQFMTEFNYIREAEQLERVRSNMIASNIAGDSTKKCAIPRPYLNLCTKRVLVMEELKGNKLVDELKKDMKRQMDRVNNTLDKLGDEKKEGFAKEFSLGENGPTSEEYQAYIKLLDAKRRVDNAFSAMYNVSVGWLPGVKKREYLGKSTLPINHAKLIDDLLYIHGHQV
jgi:aarF domain-containing kinase